VGQVLPSIRKLSSASGRPVGPAVPPKTNDLNVSQSRQIGDDRDEKQDQPAADESKIFEIMTVSICGQAHIHPLFGAI
jgi:hypothetical protein